MVSDKQLIANRKMPSSVKSQTEAGKEIVKYERRYSWLID